MSKEEFESILIPGARLEPFIIDPEEMEGLIRKTHERQEEILKLKIITKETLETIITI